MGDALMLSKPSGTGLALASGDGAAVGGAVATMRQLNRRASTRLREHRAGVHAVTDVTGFGLLGHGWEMADRSDAHLIFAAEALPLLDGVRAVAERGVRTGGDAGNRDYVAGHVTLEDEAPALAAIAFDTTPGRSTGRSATASATGVTAPLGGARGGRSGCDRGQRAARGPGRVGPSRRAGATAGCAGRGGGRPLGRGPGHVAAARQALQQRIEQSRPVGLDAGQLDERERAVLAMVEREGQAEVDAGYAIAPAWRDELGCHPLVRDLEADLFSPPASATGRIRPEVLRALIRRRYVVGKDGTYFAARAVRAAGKILAGLARSHPKGVTVSEARQAPGTTRKWAVPLLQLLDDAGVTTRHGDRRTVHPPPPTTAA